MKGQTNPHILQGRLPRKLRNAPTDAERTLWQRLNGRQLEGRKFRRQHPLRFWKSDVFENIEGALETILRHLLSPAGSAGAPPPPPSPSLEGGH